MILLEAKPCKFCEDPVIKKPTESRKTWEERTAFCSRLCADTWKIGKKMSPRTKPPLCREKSPLWKGGKPKCKDCGNETAARTATYCVKCYRKNHMQGSESNAWNGGGITPLNQALRTCKKYSQWRAAVLKRDEYKCTECGEGGPFHVDHIKAFAKIIREFNLQSVADGLKCDELWNVENGKTLCIPCHKETDTFCQRVSLQTIQLRFL